jgi:hypothetical protein
MWRLIGIYICGDSLESIYADTHWNLHMLRLIVIYICGDSWESTDVDTHRKPQFVRWWDLSTTTRLA